MTLDLPPELWSLIDTYRRQAFKTRIQAFELLLQFPQRINGFGILGTSGLLRDGCCAAVEVEIFDEDCYFSYYQVIWHIERTTDDRVQKSLFGYLPREKLRPVEYFAYTNKSGPFTNYRGVMM